MCSAFDGKVGATKPRRYAAFDRGVYLPRAFASQVQLQPGFILNRRARNAEHTGKVGQQQGKVCQLRRQIKLLLITLHQTSGLCL